MDTLTPSLPRQGIDSQDQLAEFAPMRMLDIELGEPLPVFSALDEQTNQYYQRALCVIRLHTHPLGLVELPFVADELRPQDYVDRIWTIVGAHINRHLQADSLAPVSALDPAGLITHDTPCCLEERERFLAHAPFVSVIVPTHNRPDLVQRCINSLLELYYPNYEIIIVDNAPGDNATAELIEHSYADQPRVRYVREDQAGVARARTLGMHAANGSILVYIDDDVLVDTYLLAEIVKDFTVTDNVACVTGDILPLELETPAQFWIEEYGGFSKGFEHQIFDLKEHRPANQPLYPYTAGRFGAGAIMAFKADYLRSVGGFDAALQYGSDIEAFFQVVSRGYQLVYEPSALVRHPHYREYDKLRKQIYNYGTGLTAYLTKAILNQPARLLELMTKIPYGLYFVLSSRSPKNHKKHATYPPELTRSELAGMLRGPFIYLKRRRGESRALAARVDKG